MFAVSVAGGVGDDGLSMKVLLCIAVLLFLTPDRQKNRGGIYLYRFVFN